MKAIDQRYAIVASIFPQLDPLLLQLDAAGIAYSLGGSATMYIQGNDRLPNDIDLMFSKDNHIKANKLFGLTMEVIKRPTVSMHKSSPFGDGSFDFLSNYTAIADNRTYWTPLESVLEMRHGDRTIRLVTSEKIAIFKLISKRTHHNDLEDFENLYNNPDFDKSLFWNVAQELDATKVIKNLLVARGLVE